MDDLFKLIIVMIVIIGVSFIGIIIYLSKDIEPLIQIKHKDKFDNLKSEIEQRKQENKKFIVTYRETIQTRSNSKSKNFELKEFKKKKEAETYFLDKVNEFREKLISEKYEGEELLNSSPFAYGKTYNFYPTGLSSNKIPTIRISISEY